MLAVFRSVKHQPVTFARDPSTIFILSTKACFHLGTKLPAAVSAPGSEQEQRFPFAQQKWKEQQQQSDKSMSEPQFDCSFPLKWWNFPSEKMTFSSRPFQSRAPLPRRPSPATYSPSMPCISVCVSGYHTAVPYIMRTEVTVCHRLYWEPLLMNRAKRGRDAGLNTFHATWKSLFHL